MQQDMREKIISTINKLRQCSKDAESGEHLTRVVADGFSTIADLFDVFENEVSAPPAPDALTAAAAAAPNVQGATGDEKSSTL